MAQLVPRYVYFICTWLGIQSKQVFTFPEWIIGVNIHTGYRVKVLNPLSKWVQKCHRTWKKGNISQKDRDSNTNTFSSRVGKGWLGQKLSILLLSVSACFWHFFPQFLFWGYQVKSDRQSPSGDHKNILTSVDHYRLLPSMEDTRCMHVYSNRINSFVEKYLYVPRQHVCMCHFCYAHWYCLDMVGGPSISSDWCILSTSAAFLALLVNKYISFFAFELAVQWTENK